MELYEKRSSLKGKGEMGIGSEETSLMTCRSVKKFRSSLIGRVTGTFTSSVVVFVPDVVARCPCSSRFSVEPKVK